MSCPTRRDRRNVANNGLEEWNHKQSEVHHSLTNTNMETGKRSIRLTRRANKTPTEPRSTKNSERSSTETSKGNKRKEGGGRNAGTSLTKKRKMKNGDPEWCPGIQRRLTTIARSTPSHNYCLRRRSISIGTNSRTYSSSNESESSYASDEYLERSDSPHACDGGIESTRRALNFMETPQQARSSPECDSDTSEQIDCFEVECLHRTTPEECFMRDELVPEAQMWRRDSVGSMDAYLDRNQFFDPLGVDHLGEEEKFSCPICKRIFLNGPLLYAHVKNLHDEVGKALCCVCGKGSESRVEMKTHLLAHRRCRFCLGGPFGNLYLHQLLCGWNPNK